MPAVAAVRLVVVQMYPMVLDIVQIARIEQKLR
jgi:hypothetical protein